MHTVHACLNGGIKARPGTLGRTERTSMFRSRSALLMSSVVSFVRLQCRANLRASWARNSEAPGRQVEATRTEVRLYHRPCLPPGPCKITTAAEQQATHLHDLSQAVLHVGGKRLGRLFRKVGHIHAVCYGPDSGRREKRHSCISWPSSALRHGGGDEHAAPALRHHRCSLSWFRHTCKVRVHECRPRRRCSCI